MVDILHLHLVASRYRVMSCQTKPQIFDWKGIECESGWEMNGILSKICSVKKI